MNLYQLTEDQFLYKINTIDQNILEKNEEKIQSSFDKTVKFFVNLVVKYFNKFKSNIKNLIGEHATNRISMYIETIKTYTGLEDKESIQYKVLITTIFSLLGYLIVINRQLLLRAAGNFTDLLIEFKNIFVNVSKILYIVMPVLAKRIFSILADAIGSFDIGKAIKKHLIRGTSISDKVKIAFYVIKVGLAYRTVKSYL